MRMRSDKRGIIQFLLHPYLILGVIIITLIGIISSMSDTALLQVTPADQETRFTYTYSPGSVPLSIGDVEFTPQRPTFSCDLTEDGYRYPEPDISCWSVPVSYDGDMLSLQPGESTRLSEIMSVTPEIEDLHVMPGKRDTNYEVVFTFNVSANALSARLRSPQEQIALDKELSALLTVQNRLPDFSDDQAGVWVRYSHGMLPRGEKLHVKTMSFDHGENSYQVPLDTSELGKVDVAVQPFVKIQADSEITIYGKRKTGEYEVELPEKTRKETAWYVDVLKWLAGWFN